MNYLQNLLHALRGKSAPPPGAASADLARATPAELRARIASLHLDLKEREERMAAMKREYGSLGAARDQARSSGGQEQLEKLLQRIAGTLGSLVVLAESSKQGKEVLAGDFADLVLDMVRQLKAFGIDSIGQVDEACGFDVSAHQRMSGGSVHAGGPVTIQVPGLRLGGKVIQKALVTSQEKQ